jgi:hypothetical protein
MTMENVADHLPFCANPECVLHVKERFKPGATAALLHRDRRSPWSQATRVLTDPDCRLMEVNGRVGAWFTTVKSARCN